MLALLAALALIGPALTAAPSATLGVTLAVALSTAAFIHPPLAAYVLVAATPLIVGINRSALVPLLRPNEALGLLLGGAVFARCLLRAAADEPLNRRLRTTDGPILVLLVTGSLLPVTWMAMRGKAISEDDVLYALVLWKYYFLYLTIRFSVSTPQQVRRCLWLSMVAGAIVAIIGILQALKLFGVPNLLAVLYAPYGDTGWLFINRATSTISHAQAMADVMIFNLAIVAGWLHIGAPRKLLLQSLFLLFVLGCLASGQFSGALGLVVGVLAIGLITMRLQRAMAALVGTAAIATWMLQPVIAARSGGPSVEGRLHNLRTYFWPELTSNFNYVLGVRPAARVCLEGPGQKCRFIESGHTWLLWTGGIPFFVGFFVFLWTNLRAMARLAKSRDDAIGVAAIAAFAALAVLAVVTVADPHLTLRGSGDLLFSLLALAYTDYRKGRTGSATDRDLRPN